MLLWSVPAALIVLLLYVSYNIKPLTSAELFSLNSYLSVFIYM